MNPAFPKGRGRIERKSGVNRIERKFKELKKKRKKAFIAFITAGYPNLGLTRKLVFELAGSGVDILELGVPFSDPMADGRVIQEASQKALEHKVNLGAILRLVKAARSRTEIPICLMSYYNPIFCFGEEKFVQAAVRSGVDGIIIPDLPPEEARPLVKLTHKYGLDLVCFISPTTSTKRIKYISAAARGFIYYVSFKGVTGSRQALAGDIKGQLKAIKRITKKPVCVGFGVATAQQVKEIYQIADGVIVGSAIINKIKENIGRPDLIKRVGGFTRRLSDV
ncbi:MAG: tryptophan synthase subunit alpha [Candidatus Omnitrophica bacterium]|nr:tryptophan synthase subunit alpha [Candidatus Omnitrophota bacterium]